MAHADVLVWVLFARGFFEIVAAYLLLREPMVASCKGRNRGFHQLLAALLAAHSLSAFNRGLARAANPYPLPASSLMLTDLILLALCIVVAAWLGYELVKYRETRTLGESSWCDRIDCPYEKEDCV